MDYLPYEMQKLHNNTLVIGSAGEDIRTALAGVLEKLLQSS